MSGVRPGERGQAGAWQTVTVLDGAPVLFQEGTEGGEGTCTSLSRAVTKAGISELRIPLTITTHCLVAVVVEGAQQGRGEGGSQDQYSIWIQSHAKGCILVADMTNRRPGPELGGWPLTWLLFL